MPTYQSELAGVSPIIEQPRPTKSKHDLNQEYKKNHELALDQKAIRLLNDDNHQMMEYKHNLGEALWNPYEEIKKQLREWKYKTITDEREAIKTPYRRAA